MKAVNIQEVYYATSPLRTDRSDPDFTTKEKRLSYLLGTVSTRPVLVIREPKVWDNFGTVVVLPALSHERLTMSVEMYDRYGRYVQDYKFCAHTPHTIPVSRLGRYIGRVSDDEFAEILEAFIWTLGDSSGYRVPQVYERAVNEEQILSRSRPQPPTDPTLYVKTSRSDGTVTFTTEHGAKDPLTLTTSFDMDVAVCPTEVDRATEEVFSDFKNDVLAPVSRPKTAVEWSWPDDTDVAEVKWPESVISHENLAAYASEFRIPERYYTYIPPRTTQVLTEDELLVIRGDELSSFQGQEVAELYDSLTYFDQTFLCPRWKIETMAKVFDIMISEARMLKRLSCNLRNMLDEEYNNRLERTHMHVLDADADDTTDEIIEDHEDYTVLRPYLVDKQITQIPENLQGLFLKAPQHIIKTMYVGKMFKSRYNEAVTLYQGRAKSETAE